MKTGPIKMALGVLLALIAAAMAVTAFHQPLAWGLQQAAMLLLGLVAMAALANFAGEAESSANAPLVQFPSNDRRADAVGYSRAGDGGVERRERRQRPAPWAPSTDELLEQDPALALAKLRIDIEGELRRVASGRRLPQPLDTRHAPLHQLLDALQQLNLLDGIQRDTLDDVLRDCNAAIHGAEPASAMAATVIDAGTRVLGMLRHI